MLYIMQQSVCKVYLSYQCIYSIDIFCSKFVCRIDRAVCGEVLLKGKVG